MATCAPGLETFLAGELGRLGCEGVDPGRGAVRFRGAWPEVWRANHWLRTANRVLVQIAAFAAATSEELYAGAGRILERELDGVALSELLEPRRSFAVSSTSTRSRLRDTRWISLRTKDAIADAQRARFGRRSDVDTRRPEVPLRIWLHDDRATLYLDSSREPLDRRGYRRVSGAAPLREQLAAACVLASGWSGQGPVVDPMCGTGTLLVEAAWIALGRAPGALRDEWVFEGWPGFDATRFARARDENPPGPALSRQAPSERETQRTTAHGVFLYGRDLSPAAIRAAAANLDAAGLAGHARLEIDDGHALEPPQHPGLVVTNPAHGERLESSDQDWRRLGDLLKRRYAGWSCVVLAGAPSFGKPIGLRPRRRYPVKNGPLDARILVFDLYAGSRESG